MDIHLALEVKTFFDLQRALVQNLALRSLNFPLTAVNDITGKGREREKPTHNS
jgi:hypothetical protein